MIIEPRMRGFICLTAHPKGCEQNILNQVAYIKSRGTIEGPKRALVIGASTGFGLASRITIAFGLNASTIGVYFEKPPLRRKRLPPAGIILQLLKNRPARQVCMPKALMVMLFQMK